MTTPFRGWALGVLVFAAVCLVGLMGLIATKPTGWPLGRWALILTVPALILFLKRRFKGRAQNG